MVITKWQWCKLKQILEHHLVLAWLQQTALTEIAVLCKRVQL